MFQTVGVLLHIAALIPIYFAFMRMQT